MSLDQLIFTAICVGLFLLVIITTLWILELYIKALRLERLRILLRIRRDADRARFEARTGKKQGFNVVRFPHSPIKKD